MWITNQTARRSPGGPAFQIGMVVGNESQGIAVRAKSEYRSMRLAGPWGVYSLPPEGAQAVIFPAGNLGEPGLCVGTVSAGEGLEPGELCLCSSGGAKIYLRNNGEVVINGQVFPKGEE